jgi:hypothetical protein
MPTLCAENIHNGALGSGSSLAFTRRFDERSFHFLQVADLCSNVFQVIQGSVFHLAAGKSSVHHPQEFADFVEGKAQLTASTNEYQSLHMVIRIETMATVSARWLR